jgi:hypothetical protein
VLSDVKVVLFIIPSITHPMYLHNVICLKPPG